MDLWDHIHAERARLAGLLEGLTPEQWATRSLCTEWSVEQVTAHLTAAANTGTWAWIRSIVRSGFSTNKHNERLLRKYLGRNHEETLEMYQRSISLRVAPTKDYAAFLGEVVVHGQDIARPLGKELTPDPVGVVEVARFFAAKDFAVNSKTLVKDLRMEAVDAAFESGSGPTVRGNLLDLVMVMAGRCDYCAALSGEGVGEADVAWVDVSSAGGEDRTVGTGGTIGPRFGVGDGESCVLDLGRQQVDRPVVGGCHRVFEWSQCGAGKESERETAAWADAASELRERGVDALGRGVDEGIPGQHAAERAVCYS